MTTLPFVLRTNLTKNNFPIVSTPDDDQSFQLKLYPFQAFEEALTRMDTALKVGGYLAIQNANYFFMDAISLASRYQAHPVRCPDNFVPVVNRQNHTFEQVNTQPCFFRKMAAAVTILNDS